MIREVNAVMVEMQGALLARSLYPEAHPRITSCETRALGLLDELLLKQPEITVFTVDDRVIFENEILPSSPSLADALFRMLQLVGVDQLTFRRGLGSAEIQDFLDTLIKSESGDAEMLRSCAHLAFGSLKAMDRDPDTLQRLQSPHALTYAEEAAYALPAVWAGTTRGMRFDTARLGDIVSCLCAVVADSSHAILPLAPLKKHDEYTFVHTINVAILSTSLAEALGMDSATVYDISMAALLHDVGKTMIPKEILNKDGIFTREEFRIMQAHPVEGARILANTPGVPELAPIVAYEHHVRADLGGYPRVPRGWKLNLASRIVQIADVFDALRTNRSYRPGQPVPKIAVCMRQDVGTFFDADLLRVFFEDVVSQGIPAPAHKI